MSRARGMGMPWDQPEPGSAGRLDGAADARRAYRVPVREKAWQGWSPDAAPARVLPPRCGRVLALDGRYERAGVPGDPGHPPACGRPAGHPPAANGSPGCRSEAAVARYRLADLDRQAASRRARERSRAT